MGNQLKRPRRQDAIQRVEDEEEDSGSEGGSSLSITRQNLISPKCGHWIGTYSQYGTDYPFFMDLLFFDDQRISGSGFDEIGGYDIRGDFNRLTGQISFDKVYRGMHTVQYAGTVSDDGRVIKGLYWNSGPFEMSIAVEKPITPSAFKVTDTELKAGVLHVKYASNTDEYLRINNDNEHIHGWSNAIWQEENMYRKVEYDWKMTYLSRSPETSSSDVGSIVWKFDLGDHEVDHVKLTLKSTTFQNGEVSWSMVSDDSREVDLNALLHVRQADEGFPGNTAHFAGEECLDIQDIHGASGFTLKAVLSRGRDSDNVAWQHAQLFRQPVHDKDVYPFDIQVFIKKSQDWQMLKTVNEANKHMYDHRELASDIQFLVGSDRIPVLAHKYVLITRSPVFYSMFYGGLPQDDSHQVVLPDVEEGAFQEFLRYLYCDEANITPDNVFEVFYTAKKYLVTSLTKICIRFIVTHLSKDNCCSVLTQAVLSDEVQLMSQTKSFIFECLGDVYDNESYRELSMDALVYMLRNSVIDTNSTEFKKMIDIWLEEECHRRGVDKTTENKSSIIIELKKQIPLSL